MLRNGIFFFVIILSTTHDTHSASDLPQRAAVSCPRLLSRCHQRTLKKQLRSAADQAYLNCREGTVKALWAATGQADLEAFETRKEQLLRLMQQKPSDWLQARWRFSHPRGGYAKKCLIDAICNLNGAFIALNPNARQPTSNRELSEFVEHPLVRAVCATYTDCFLQSDCTILSPRFPWDEIHPSYLEFLVRDWTHIALLRLQESMKLELALEHIGTAQRYNTFLQASSHRLPYDLNMLIGQLCFGSPFSKTTYIEKLCTQLEKRKTRTKENVFDIFFKRCMHMDGEQSSTPWPSFWESRLLRSFIYAGLAEPHTYDRATQRTEKRISFHRTRSRALAIAAMVLLCTIPLAIYFFVVSTQTPDNERPLKVLIFLPCLGLLFTMPGILTLCLVPLRKNRKALKKAKHYLVALAEHNDRWPILARATNRARLSFEDENDELPDVIPMHSEV